MGRPDGGQPFAALVDSGPHRTLPEVPRNPPTALSRVRRWWWFRLVDTEERPCGGGWVEAPSEALQAPTRFEFAEAFAEVSSALVIDMPSRAAIAEYHVATTPIPEGDDDAPGGNDGALPKHVTAGYRCIDCRRRARHLRMAAGWWRLGPVICGFCTEPFMCLLDGPLSTGPQLPTSPVNR